MLFAAEVGGIPFGSPDFWKLNLLWLLRLLDYHQDRLSAQIEAAEEQQKKFEREQRSRRR
jgi:hypothetical protein